MFSVLVSLPGWAQPGEPVTPCQETFQIPISYSLRTLPCHSSDPLSKEFIISLGPGSGSQYVVSDPSNQSTITGPTINNGVYTYKISFDATGWRRLVITTNKECFETTILDVPVLCECPSLPYKVLGNLTQNETKVTGSDLSGVANFYIINNIILNDFIDIHIEGQSFTVLGKNEYNRSTPGGNIFGPWIFIGKYLPIYSAVYCGSNNGDLTTFKGDPCFGMWGGINVPFPAINAQTLRMENTLIRDAYRAVGLTMGISGVAEIENCSFFSNLYGIVSKHISLRKFKDNKIESGEMLKPFDYTAGGHNQYLEQFTNTKNKFYTRYGLWVHGRRPGTNRMIGPDWTNNEFNNCISGIRFSTDFKVLDNYFDSEGNYFIRNRFSGIINDGADHSFNNLLVKNAIFQFENPDNFELETIQLNEERVLWNKQYTYGVINYQMDGDNTFIDNHFLGINSNNIGIFSESSTGKISNNAFKLLSVGVKAPAMPNRLEYNLFDACDIGLYLDGPNGQSFSPHCNRFYFNDPLDIAFRISENSTPSNSQVCTPNDPCGNMFTRDGRIIENHNNNSSVTYWRYDNEKIDNAIHSSINSQIIGSGSSGDPTVNCVLDPIIFARRIISNTNGVGQPEIILINKIPNNSNYKIIDLTGREVVSGTDIVKIYENLNSGTYILNENGKNTLIKK